MQTWGVKERLHEGNGLGTGVGVALLGKGNVCVEAGVKRTGYFWVGLSLKIRECKGRYVDEC